MIFIGCCVNGELYEDSNGIIYLKRYVHSHSLEEDWMGEEDDSYNETVTELESYA